MQQKALAETDSTTTPKRFRNKEARSSYYYVVEKKEFTWLWWWFETTNHGNNKKNPMGYVAWSLTDIAPEKVTVSPNRKGLSSFPTMFQGRTVEVWRCPVASAVAWAFFSLEFSAVFWGCHFHHFSGAVAEVGGDVFYFQMAKAWQSCSIAAAICWEISQIDHVYWGMAKQSLHENHDSLSCGPLVTFMIHYSDKNTHVVLKPVLIVCKIYTHTWTFQGVPINGWVPWCH